MRAHELDVTAYAIDRLARVEGLTVLGPRDAAAAARSVSFALDGVHPHDVAEILARDGVCIRAGHHCAQPLMRTLGVPATSRASFGVHNTRADVDRLIDGARRGRSGSSPSHGRPLPRADPRALQAPPQLGHVDDPDLEFEDNNPLCGDELQGQLNVDGDGASQDLRFSGHGCAISQAAASMVSDEVKGMTVDESPSSTSRSCSTCSASTSPRRG